jgi:NADH-quinone oxidoreductase subunit M
MTIHLSIMLWLPLAAGVLALALPAALARWTGVLGSAMALAYAAVLAADYGVGDAGPRYVTDESWISALGVSYSLAATGLNVVLVLTACVVFFAVALWAALRGEPAERAGTYVFLMGLAQSGVVGALLAQDLILFVVFFDVMLVPFYFLTLMWGGPERGAAVLKLFIYTLVGSLLMLVGAIATGVLAAGDGEVSFALRDLRENLVESGSQKWIFLTFAAAFLVKMPSFPFHGWMPDGYRQMPIAPLAAFTAILSKVAVYGFLAIALPLYPQGAAEFQDLVLIIALVSVLYGSVMAFTTTQARLVLGYSSLAQLGFMVLGVFALDERGADGALLQAANHALVSVPLVLIVALLAARAGGSEDLRDMGGLAKGAPVFAAVFLVLSFALLAMPGTSNFIGEFFILLGLFDTEIVLAIIASIGVVLAATYALRFYIRAMHNRVGPHAVPRELSVRDGLVVVAMTLVIVALSLYPQFGLGRSERDVKAALAQPKAAQDGPAVARAPAGEERP